MDSEQKIKKLEEEIETLKINIELLIRVISRLQLNGEPLWTKELKKMIKEHN